ncbi:MAG: hypothetical protein ACRELX_18415 [Longimicrobiales bacterium]
MRVALLRCAALVVCVAACDPAGRRADEVAELRERAIGGIEAVEAFCAEQDSVVARAKRGEPGADRALAEVLLAPVILNDYCAEFRFHAHDQQDEPAGDTARGGVR